MAGYSRSVGTDDLWGRILTPVGLHSESQPT
jgi:hypothetical protein